MQPLSTAIRRLEHLSGLVEELAPMRYQSTSRSLQLSKEIPEAYDAVEDVYRHYAGDREVIVEDERSPKAFRNFFEAGWLSGRTFHANEGRKELKKVTGRVRAEIEDQFSSDMQPADSNEVTFKLLHPSVQLVANERFRAGHYADSVEAALKELTSAVRKIVLQRGGAEMDGTTLMQKAFSPENPIIVLADLTNQSGRDMQRGYMQMFAGVMAAVRNPKAHGNVTISQVRAIHLLFVVSTLWYTLDERP